MVHETFEALEMGEAEALIEISCGELEENIDKQGCPTAPYVEFDDLIWDSTT